MPYFSLSRLRAVALGLWIVLTTALAGWWYYFLSAQTEIIEGLAPEMFVVVQRQRRMLMWEGGSLLILVLIGGVWLAWLAYRDQKRSQQLTLFFATFTHDLKTALASLSLQLEAVTATTEDPGQVEALLEDAHRIRCQLDNALAITSFKDQPYLVESIDLSELIRMVRQSWPALEFRLSGDATVRADRRALTLIFHNLMHNALVHGRAQSVTVETNQHGRNVEVAVHDDGVGTSIPTNMLGRRFQRNYPGSGCGLGLYIVSSLIKKMGGSFSILSPAEGFRCALLIPGSVK